MVNELMKTLLRLSGIARNFLSEISDYLDEIINASYEKDSSTSVDDAAIEKDTSISGIERIIQSYEGFDPVPFSFPCYLGHMELEVIKVHPDDLFKLTNTRMEDRVIINARTGEKKVIFSDGPTIATTTKTMLDGIDSTMLIGMRECFPFIREIKFEFGVGLPSDVAEEVLTGIIGRIMKETGWTFEEVLLSILMRDILKSVVVDAISKDGKSIQDTMRLYYTSENICRWAVVSYHSPSLNFGKLIVPGDEGFPEDKIGGQSEF